MTAFGLDLFMYLKVANNGESSVLSIILCAFIAAFTGIT